MKKIYKLINRRDSSYIVGYLGFADDSVNLGVVCTFFSAGVDHG